MAASLRVRKIINIRQPVDMVYHYLSHFHFVQEWDTSVLKAWMMSTGKPAVGSRFQVLLLFGWNRIKMDYEIVSMRPHHELVLKGRAPSFVAVDHIDFEKIPGGTRLTYSAEVEFQRPPPTLLKILIQMLFGHYAGKAMKRLNTMLSGTPKIPALSPLTKMADRTILPGLLGFTKWGYIRAKNRAPVASALYLDRTMVLTGGTSGIGKAAAQELYQKGAHLVVVGRSQNKLDDLRRELTSHNGRGRIDTEMAVLSLTTDIRQLAERLNQRRARIDVLINNAGALFNRYEKTQEGIENTLATDLLGPYLLTRLLLPALRASNSSRIINVASGGMYTQKISQDFLTMRKTGYDGPGAYAQAKRGLVILTKLWARELAPYSISAHAMHPGWVDTPGLEKALPAFHQFLRPLLRSPAQGADTIVWLAAAPDAPKASGKFWLDRKIRAEHVFPRTRESARDRADLMMTLQNLTGLSSRH